MDLSVYGIDPLTIKDKHLIDNILHHQDTMLSAYSFTSHYIWRDHFNFYRGTINGYLCLFAQYGDYVYMPVPPVSLENTDSPRRVYHPPTILPDLFRIMDKINNNRNVSRIENIDESGIEAYVAAGYKIKPGEPEYVYLREDLSRLKGDSYKSKRAMCNYFEKHYRYSYEPFDTRHAAQGIELYNSWSQNRTQKLNDTYYKAMLEDSFVVHREVINNYKALELRGRVVIIDNRVEGYIFGFERGKDIFYILLEVANPGMKGLAQFIFREFCKELKGYTYINALGDSGLENLCKVKRSYRPVRIAPSFIAYRD